MEVKIDVEKEQGTEAKFSIDINCETHFNLEFSNGDHYIAIENLSNFYLVQLRKELASHIIGGFPENERITMLEDLMFKIREFDGNRKEDFGQFLKELKEIIKE